MNNTGAQRVRHFNFIIIIGETRSTAVNLSRFQKFWIHPRTVNSYRLSLFCRLVQESQNSSFVSTAQPNTKQLGQLYGWRGGYEQLIHKTNEVWLFMCIFLRSFKIKYLRNCVQNDVLENINSRNRVIVEKLLVVYLIKTFSAVYGIKRLLTCSAQSVGISYLEQHKTFSLYWQ